MATVKFFTIDETAGDYRSDKTQTIASTAIPVKLIPNQYTKDGYLFVGWARYPWSDEIAFEDGAIFEWMDCFVSGDFTPLYAVWESRTPIEEDLTMCIEGYDPFPVLFRDMSDVRSFRTAYWKWDFGDSRYYGCDTKNTPQASFMLPGDTTLYKQCSAGWNIPGRTFLTVIDELHNSNPTVRMQFDYSGNAGNSPPGAWESYHYNASANNHFTGAYFSSITGNAKGAGVERNSVIPGTYGQKRYEYWPNSSFITPVKIPFAATAIPEDQCGRVACEYEATDFKNSVLHIFKGPGIYYTTMTCSSDTGLRGMDVDESVAEHTIIDGAPERIEECYVRVHPVCPCIDGFRVYGTRNTTTTDSEFVTITADDFCCESMDISSVTGAVSGKNCKIWIKDEDGNDNCYDVVSGYAPFFEAAASGIVVPRSLPCIGAFFDWSDWHTDLMANDYTDFIEVIGGWPTWRTRRSESGGNGVSGEHVYTLPGVYSVGIAPEFDTERIRRYMPTVVGYEECVDKTLEGSISANCILVVEIPPRFDESTPIVCSVKREEYPTIVTLSANVSGMSYPISRIDWDFDFDNPGKDTISISTEGYYQKDRDVKGNKDNSAEMVVYQTETTTAFPSPGYAYRSTDDGFLIGNNTDQYRRYPAHKWCVDHVYTRTSVDDHNHGYVVRCSAYAENTNTCTVASARILTTSGAGLPEYGKIEGDIEMVDIRSDQTTETNIVLQNEKDDRLYVNKVYNYE